MAVTPKDPLDTVYDSGLALERTLLAWQRTIMALIVIGVALARYWYVSNHKLLPATLGFLGLCLAFGLMAWVRWLYRKAHRALNKQGNLGARDGKPLVILLSLVSLCAVCAVLYAVF